ncbi:MAG TPA: DNA translocase FtsK, partial [Ferruginibacter sp.]|nr:DNA translocase FtsK [Ferruginibacter sp.]
FGKRVFSISRNIKYVLVGLPLISIAASVMMNGSKFPFGGTAGDLCRDWLYTTIGEVGTIGVLAVAGLSYIIWNFNPVFKLPTKNAEPDVAPDIVPEEVSEKVEWPTEENTGNANNNGNALKSEGSMLAIPPQGDNVMKHDISIVEKELLPNDLSKSELMDMDAMPLDVEEETIAPPKVEEKKPIKKAEELVPLELEIKSVPDKKIEESIAAKTISAKPYDPILDLRDYKYPTLDLLENHGSEKIVQDANELENNKNQIINTLKNYDILIQKISATVGPTVTLYEIIPAAGVRISRIKNLEDDIALSLAALGIRIIAPIPGKGTIGIEVPNAKKTVVSMKTLLASEKFQNNRYSLPIAIGKKIDNENFIVDLTTMPHLLMAGATGQGKSVGVNALLVSLLYKKHPSQLKFVLVDPKKVELSIYKTIEKHFLAKLPGEEDSIITDTKKVVHTLNALCIEMDNRYDLLKEAGCRNIKEYNEKFVARKLNPEKGHQFLPFIVLVIDEFADLIMTAGKEIEMPIARLAQLA